MLRGCEGKLSPAAGADCYIAKFLMQVKLRELEGVLREYKKENSKFFEMKERYKATIAALERQVQVRKGFGIPD